MSLQVTNYNDEWHVEVNLLNFFFFVTEVYSKRLYISIFGSVSFYKVL